MTGLVFLRRRSIATLLALVPTLIFPATARSDALTWDANGASPPNGTFSTSANWNDNSQFPTAGDTATFNLNNTYTVTFAANAASDALNVGPGTVNFRSNSATVRIYNLTTGAGDLTVNAGGTLSAGSAALPMVLNVGGILRVGNSGNGTLTADGASSALNVNGAGPHFIGLLGATATLNYTNSATGIIGGTLNVGSSPTAGTVANLNVLSGADLDVANLNIGTNTLSASSGTVTVSGSGSTLDITGASTLAIGAASGNSGVLNVSSAGVVTTGTGAITVDTTGDINLSGGGTFHANGPITVNTGGFVSVGITGNFNANQDVTLNGGSLQKLDVSGTFNLASGRTLNVQNGGDFAFAQSYFFNPNTTFNITGAGSEVTMLSPGPTVANVSVRQGSAINVTAGGSFSSAGFFAVGADGTGSVLVDGAGSTFSTSSVASVAGNGFSGSMTFRNNAVGSFPQFSVGTLGGGTLNIESGADVTCGPLFVGNAVLGFGTPGVTVLTLTGSGSTLTQNGSSAFEVGAEGPSPATTFSVQSGATFTSGSGDSTIGLTGTVNITGGTFNANGNLTLDGGNLNRDSGAAFNLAAGKTLTIQNGSDATFFSYTLNSASTINVAGSGSTLSVTNAALGIRGGGTLNVFDGALATALGAIDIGFGSNGTALVEGTGSTISSTGFQTSHVGANGFGSLTIRNQGNGSFAGLFVGTSTFDSAGVLRVESGATVTCENLEIASIAAIATGEVTITGAGSTLTQESTSPFVLGAAFGTIGTLTVADSGTFNSGTGNLTLNQTGALIVDGGSVNLNGPIVRNGGVVAFNSGALSFLGNLDLQASGLLGASLLLTPDDSVVLTGIANVPAGGSLVIDGGGFSAQSLVNGGGVIDFRRGALAITGGGSLTIGSGGPIGSSITLEAQSSLLVTGTTSIGDGALVRVDGGEFAGATIANSGTIDFRDGSLGFSGTLTNNTSGRLFLGGLASPNGPIANAGQITLQNGIGLLGGAGTLTNTGLIIGDGTIARTVINSVGGTIRAEAGKTLSFAGNAGPNAGLINLQGGTVAFSQALTNGATGQITGRGTLSFDGAGLINNGHIALSSGITDIFGDVVTNTGNAAVGITVSGNADVTFWDDVTNTSGLFRVVGGSSATFFGSFSGGGISGTGNIFFESDVTPGFSPGVARFDGNVFLGPGATTTIEIGGLLAGTDYDLLAVAGQLNLGGTLEVGLYDGFTPTLGDTFDILNFGALIGQFDVVRLPVIDGLAWDTSTLYTDGIITAVPEPTTIVLLSGGLILIGAFRRRL